MDYRPFPYARELDLLLGSKININKPITSYIDMRMNLQFQTTCEIHKTYMRRTWATVNYEKCTCQQFPHAMCG